MLAHSDGIPPNATLQSVIAHARHAARGRTVRLRPISASDAERAWVFFRKLSFGTKYFRFGRGDAEFTAAEAALLCNPDPAKCVHLVIVTEEGGHETMVAGATCHFLPDGKDCEFTVLVADAWHGKGLADMLMQAVLDYARRRGARRIFAHTLATNARMLKLARRHGFVVTSDTHPGGIKTVTLTLHEAERAGGAGDTN